jgi:hypothetical protein
MFGLDKTQSVFMQTYHWAFRLAQRFGDDEVSKVMRTVECAMKKADAGEKFKYTHPLYNITVVGRKIGLNGVDLITCWKQGEWDKEYL